jgi:hypothetical protein
VASIERRLKLLGACLARPQGALHLNSILHLNFKLCTKITRCSYLGSGSTDSLG